MKTQQARWIQSGPPNREVRPVSSEHLGQLAPGSCTTSMDGSFYNVPLQLGKWIIFLFLGWRGLSDFKYQVSELVVFQKGSAECGWGITNLMATCHQPWESVKHGYSQDSGNGDFWMDIDQLTRREMEIIWSMKCLLCQTVITEISCQTQISMVLGINREEGMHFLGNA